MSNPTYISSKVTIGQVIWDGDKGYAVAFDAAPPIFVRSLESSLRSVLGFLGIKDADVILWGPESSEPRPGGTPRD